MERAMETLFRLTDQRFDLQTDVYLRHGNILVSEGPDRAYLNHLYRDAHGREREEVAALWVFGDPLAAETLATGLGAPDPQVCGTKPFRVLWIRDGIIATHSAPLGIDRAMWLVTALADQDVLDRDAQLFGTQGVEVGDA
jgi:hypothetical protein